MLALLLVAQPIYAEEAMKLRMTINQKSAVVELADNPTARDFAALLPMSLTLKDYAQTEKIGDLPKALTKDGAPAAMTPKAGDVTFYAPWGNLALFYRDGHHSPGLIRLGRIVSGMDALDFDGTAEATIERTQP